MNNREMVDSGVDWIGEIPANWDTSQLKYIASIKKGKPLPIGTLPCDLTGTPYINGGYKPSFYVSIEGNTPAQTITISSGGASAGFCQMLDVNSWIGSDCHIILPHIKNNKIFLYWTLKGAEDYRKYNQTGTAMPHVNKSDLANFILALPPLSEQQSIANFLDHHVNLIDRELSLIDKKIELLGEKRKALIFECVTGKRSVVQRSSVTNTANVVGHGDLVAVSTVDEQLVNSGVDWIGAIPKSWGVQRLKDVAKVNPKTNLPVSGPISFIPMEKLLFGNLNLDETISLPSQSSYTKFLEGDLLIAKVTPCFENGKISIASNLKKRIWTRKQ